MSEEREDDAVPSEDPRETGMADQMPEENPEGQGAGTGEHQGPESGAGGAPAPDTSGDPGGQGRGARRASGPGGGGRRGAGAGPLARLGPRGRFLEVDGQPERRRLSGGAQAGARSAAGPPRKVRR